MRNRLNLLPLLSYFLTTQVWQGVGIVPGNLQTFYISDLMFYQIVQFSSSPNNVSILPLTFNLLEIIQC